MHEWVWDSSVLTSASQLFLEGQEVHFHPVYSSGTAAVRGSKPCVGGNVYYWEIKVLTPIFGTDVVRDRTWYALRVGSVLVMNAQVP